MNIANIYRKLKQILKDSNTALVNRGLNEVIIFNNILSEIDKLGTINRLPYLFKKEIVEVVLEDFGNATSISNRTFTNCVDIERVSIPNNVTSIERGTFYTCTKLKDLCLYSTTPPQLMSKDEFASKKIPTIHVPVGSADTYKTATNWSYYAFYIVDDIII